MLVSANWFAEGKTAETFQPMLGYARPTRHMY